MKPLVLDLLRERRQELGQEPMAALIAERPRLLWEGLLVGAGLVGLVAGTTLMVFLRLQYVQSQMGELDRYEAEATALRSKAAAGRTVLERLNETNRQLAAALTDVRSSSALLADLQLHTPEGVQLTEAMAAGADLKLKGVARDPMAFARINALQLELQRSLLLRPDGIRIVRVQRQDLVTPRQVIPQAGPVAFEIKASFAPLIPTAQLAAFRALGAEGMARRLQLLSDEGLIGAEGQR